MNISKDEEYLLEMYANGIVQVIKKLPWQCGNCGQAIFTITYEEDKECFHFQCPGCKSEYYA